MKKFSVFSYLLLIILVLAAGYFLSKSFKKNSLTQIACTQDIKQCEDGTFVKRVAPQCEFEACPVPVVNEEGKNETASTIKTTFDVSQKVSFGYPDNFYIGTNLTEYVVPVQWPPEIVVSAEKFSCKVSGNQVLPGGKTETKIVNGKTYCVTTQSEGAAGSVYTTYIYKTSVKPKTVSLTFIVRVPQCANYDEPKKTACEEEKKNFDINQMMENIFQTVKFSE